jgi:hypothetical protein
MNSWQTNTLREVLEFVIDLLEEGRDNEMKLKAGNTQEHCSATFWWIT